MGTKMTYKMLEKKELERLYEEKNAMIDRFIGRMEMLNAQIKDVKSGRWAERLEKYEEDAK